MQIYGSSDLILVHYPRFQHHWFPLPHVVLNLQVQIQPHSGLGAGLWGCEQSVISLRPELDHLGLGAQLQAHLGHDILQLRLREEILLCLSEIIMTSGGNLSAVVLTAVSSPVPVFSTTASRRMMFAMIYTEWELRSPPEISGKTDVCFIKFIKISITYRTVLIMLDDTHDWHDTLSLTQLFSFRLSRSEFYGNKLVGATVLKSNLLINKGYN